jgi:protein O-GlcNAc transferase
VKRTPLSPLDRALRAYAAQDLRSAQAELEAVLRLEPKHAIAASLRLTISFYDESITAGDRLAKHREWGAQFRPRSSGSFPPFDSAGPIRVGYVSRTVLQPPRSSFLLPILESHDPAQVTSFCYSSTAGETHGAGVFRDVSALEAAGITELVRKDHIQVLVNLDGHFDAVTMPVFALRAAPVQISFPNYPGSTGLAAVDYRITDGVADPPGETEHLYSERLHRLPCFLPFAPPKNSPHPEDPPFARHGFTTFGVFGNPIKIGSQCLTAWANILNQAPTARLVFHHPFLSGMGPKGRNCIDSGIRERLQGPLHAAGISPERIAFIGGLAPWDHLDFHNEVDVVLDTLPYSGHTTTVEALWMGVPTLTVKGESFAGRMSTALLTHVGLEQFIASDWRDLTQTAIRLGHHPEVMAVRGEVLRRCLDQSPILNVHEYVCSLEAAYRQFLVGQANLLPRTNG